MRFLLSRRLVRAFVAALCLLLAHGALAQTLPPAPTVKLAVNPVTNKVYFADTANDRVIVLDAAHGTTTSIAVGSRPEYIAVNPVTNRIYVDNAGESSLSVIDGATDTNLTPTPFGIGAQGPIAVNPVTNIVYIVRLTTPATDEVTFFDANHDDWYTIATGSFQPNALSVDPLTDTIYVTHYATGDVRVVSGAFDPNNDFPQTTSIGAWSHPFAIATNPVTNKTYVITEDSRGPIGVIDDTTNTAVFNLPEAGHAVGPKALAVNPVTNRIYAAFQDEVIEIDGDTGAYTYIPIGTTDAGPMEIAVNAATNRIYVATDNGSLLAIDGETNAVTTIPIPGGAEALAVNPVTNTVYTAGPAITSTPGLAAGAAQPNPLATSIDALPGDSASADVTFTLRASSSFSPNTPAIAGVYYELDSTAAAWSAASGSGPYSASFTGLATGTHTLYAYAVDAQSTHLDTGPQSGPYLGALTSYTFTVAPPPKSDPALSLSSSSNPSTFGQSVAFIASVTGTAGTPGGSVDFLDGTDAIAGCSALPLDAGSATCTVSNLSTGSHSIAARYSGDASYNGATSAALSQSVQAPPPPGGAMTDLDGDGRSDLLYWNASTGQVYRIAMNGLRLVSGGFVYAEPDTSWHIVQDGDFNGDGVRDLLWRNGSTGRVYLMPFGRDGRPSGGAFIYTEPNAAWKIVAAPDLDGDGKADVLWWNSSTGQVYALLMDGARIVSQGFVPAGLDASWRIEAIGDFSGSGKKNQLVWRNSSTGEVRMMMVTVGASGFSASSTTFYREPNTAWHIVAAADFDGDGKSDLLWRNDSDGRVYMMLMNGTTIASQRTVYQEPNAAWKIVAEGDYDGDGKADLAWRNDTTGDVWMMLMDGLSIRTQGMAYREPDTAWKLMGPGSY